MTTELRNSDEARRYVLQGLWLQRIATPDSTTVPPSLEWAFEVLSAGEPLCPVGLVADIGHLILGKNSEVTSRVETPSPGFSSEVSRRYEDYVLGKLYADGSFERGATAICRYAQRDQTRGVAWLVSRFADRAEIDGAFLSPNVVRALQQAPREELLAEGISSLRQEGLMPLLATAYDGMIDRVRNLGNVLAVEDVFELEHGTVLVNFGQRLALRQMLQAAEWLKAAFPARMPRSLSRHRAVTTNVQDEDVYPVGGFASISTRGSIESLLHSQLAYMETSDGDQLRPDLFDIKFLRDELLYYSRDDNQFLRRRRTFTFLLYDDLALARVKEAGLEWQRIILVLATILASIERLMIWLGDEALRFEILFVERSPNSSLSDERELLKLALQEQIANGTVHVGTIAPADTVQHLEASANRSLTAAIVFSTERRLDEIETQSADVIQLDAGNAQPVIHLAESALPINRHHRRQEASEISAWQATATSLVEQLA